MSSDITKVLHFHTWERKNPHFWNEPMNMNCLMCGENPFHYSSKIKNDLERYDCNPHPYGTVKDIDYENHHIEFLNVLCRTCMLNSNISLPRIVHRSQLACWKMFLMRYVWCEKKMVESVLNPQFHNENYNEFIPQRCPLLALKKFGGTIDWLQYNDPNFVYPFPFTKNQYSRIKRPKLSIIFGFDNPIKYKIYLAKFQRDFTGSGIVCRQCLQPLDETGALPVYYDEEFDEGLFHPNGKCATRWLKELDNRENKIRYDKTKELWKNYFGWSSDQLSKLKLAPDKRLLKAFYGTLTLKQYLDSDSNSIQLNDYYKVNYPIYVDIEPITNLEIVKYQDPTKYEEKQPFESDLGMHVDKSYSELYSRYIDQEIKQNNNENNIKGKKMFYYHKWTVSLELNTMFIPSKTDDHISLKEIMEREEQMIQEQQQENEEEDGESGDDSDEDSDSESLSKNKSKTKKKQSNKRKGMEDDNEDDENNKTEILFIQNNSKHF
jgi:hypothetical protein